MLALLEAPVEIIEEAVSVDEAVQKINEGKPDLVFLDIMLQKGTGFDVLDRIETRDFKLVFVTAYDHYALKAFRFSALDYLTKPIDPDQLKETLERLSTDGNNRDLELKLESFKANRKSLNRLALHDAQGIHLIRPTEILYCQSQNNYTEFYLSDGRKILVSKTLKDFEDILSGFKFFRVHQSYLINLEEVSQYLKQDGGYVQMSDGSLIGVSRRKKEELLRYFS